MKVSEPTGRSAKSLADLAEAGRERRVQENARYGPDRDADHGEKHDRRKPQACRERLAHRHDHQQGRENAEDEDDIEHASIMAASQMAGHRNRALRGEV